MCHPLCARGGQRTLRRKSLLPPLRSVWQGLLPTEPSCRLSPQVVMGEIVEMTQILIGLTRSHFAEWVLSWSVLLCSGLFW